MKQPFQSAFHWLRAGTMELLAVLFLFPCLKVLRIFKSYEQPIGPKKGKPILLVHGYRKDSSVWFYLRKKLAKTYPGPIYVLSLGAPFQSIRTYVKLVEQKCLQIKQETECDQLILIGHSMGGLVSVLSAFGNRLISDVITIASPLGGTKMAKLGKGLNAKEMNIGSALLIELNEKLGEEQRVRFFHIGTKTDHLVVPNQSSRPGKHLDREFLFENIGHASLLFSPRVVTLLQQWLTS